MRRLPEATTALRLAREGAWPRPCLGRVAQENPRDRVENRRGPIPRRSDAPGVASPGEPERIARRTGPCSSPSSGRRQRSGRMPEGPGDERQEGPYDPEAESQEREG